MKTKVKIDNKNMQTLFNRFKIIKTILLIVLLMPLLANESNAQTTRQDVAEFIRDVFLQDSLNTFDICENEIWIADQPYSTSYTAYNYLEDIEIPLPYESTWVVMINEQPNAMWAHPCLWVFVNDSLTDFQLELMEYPPEIYDAESDPMPFDCANELIGCECVTYSYENGGGKRVIIPDVEEKDCLYAVLISGGEKQEGKSGGFWQNIKKVYNNLRSAGYKKENIYIYYRNGTDKDDKGKSDFLDLDGDTKSDVTGSAKEARAQIQKLCKERNKTEDVLFVYVSSHGNSEKFSLFDDSYSKVNFKKDTDNCNVCRLFIVIQSCKSGSFLDIADSDKHKNISVYTSAKDNQVSFINKKGGSEFTNWFFEKKIKDTNANDMFKHANDNMGEKAGMEYKCIYNIKAIDKTFHIDPCKKGGECPEYYLKVRFDTKPVTATYDKDKEKLADLPGKLHGPIKGKCRNINSSEPQTAEGTLGNGDVSAAECWEDIEVTPVPPVWGGDPNLLYLDVTGGNPLPNYQFDIYICDNPTDELPTPEFDENNKPFIPNMSPLEKNYIPNQIDENRFCFNLSFGTYYILITDCNGRAKVHCANISPDVIPPFIMNVVDVTPLDCQNVRVYIRVKSGTPEYMFQPYICPEGNFDSPEPNFENGQPFVPGNMQPFYEYMQDQNEPNLFCFTLPKQHDYYILGWGALGCWEWLCIDVEQEEVPECPPNEVYDPEICNCVPDIPCTSPPICNDDPCFGDIEMPDPTTCECIVDQPQVLGCTDPDANNYNPDANCDDGSCMPPSNDHNYITQINDIHCQKPGDTICINLIAQNEVADGINGIDYEITYPNQIMQPTGKVIVGDVVNNGGKGAGLVNTQLADDKVRVSIYYAGEEGTETLTGKGQIACVQFVLIGNPIPNTYNNVGTNEVELSFENEVKNEPCADTFFTIQNNVPPTIACPIEMTIIYLDDNGIATLEIPTATDNCEVISNKLSREEFGCEDVGVIHTVTSTATDCEGATTTCDFMVEVKAKTTAKGKVLYWNEERPIGGKKDDFYDTNIILCDADAPITAVDDKGCFSVEVDDATLKYDVARTKVCKPDFKIISGQDALLAAMLSAKYKAYPQGGKMHAFKHYQPLAADYNDDGKVAAGDATQILDMAVGKICPDKKLWQFQKKGVFGGAEFVLDAGFPDNDDVGVDRADVHPIPNCFTLATDVCIESEEVIIYGILKGDVDGSWKNGISYKRTPKTFDDCGVQLNFDEQTNTGNGNYIFPISFETAGTTNALDVDVFFNEDIENIIAVELTEFAKTYNVNMAWNYIEAERRLLISAFTLQEIKVTEALFLVEIETATKPTEAMVIKSKTFLEGMDCSIVPIIEIEPHKFSIYPNPNAGSFQVELEKPLLNSLIEVVDASGKTHYQSQLSQSINYIDVYLTNVKPGIYFIKVTDADSIGIQKVVIQY